MRSEDKPANKRINKQIDDDEVTEVLVTAESQEGAVRVGEGEGEGVSFQRLFQGAYNAFRSRLNSITISLVRDVHYIELVLKWNGKSWKSKTVQQQSKFSRKNSIFVENLERMEDF